jgi:capsular exopolysaccharide synthesis family protein
MDPLKAQQQQQETKLHFLDYWRIIRIRKTVILAVFFLVVITSTVVTFLLTPAYSSSARIKIERDQTDISGVTSQQTPNGYDPYFIQTEFEVIKSEVILTNVVADLENGIKQNSYAPAVAEEIRNMFIYAGRALTDSEKMEVVKRNIDLRTVRNTSLIDINVYAGSPGVAATIANSVARTYRQYRLDQRKLLTTEGINALQDRLKEQEEKIHEAQTNVDYQRAKCKVSDYMAGGNQPTVLITAETLRRIEQLRIESQAELVRQQTLLEKLNAMKDDPDRLAEVIPTSGIQDQLLSSLLEQRTVAEQRLVSLAKEYGPENTEYKKASSMVADLKDKIKERVAGVLSGLETHVASLGQSVTNLLTEVDKAMKTDLEKASESQPYWEAKQHLEELQHFSQILYMKIAGEKTDLQLPKNSMVEVIDTAKPVLKPVKPNKALNIGLGIIIGLVVGVGLAFFIEYLDTSVKTIDDVERALGAPVLGVVPQNVGILLDEGAESPHAEAYRVLRTNLLFSRKDDKLNTLAVVSAGAGEGKSTTVFNLAAVFAQSGQRVLMVDSDLRRPTLHKMLRVTNSIGLTNYLLKQNTLEEVIQTTSLPTLDFMASGKLPSSSLGILSSAQMRDLITELKQHYDFIFFDSPPVMGVSDASILASEVDMTLQVIQYRRYPQPMNIRAKQLIEKVGGNLVGIVLNNINMSQDESYYYYSGYYHDYYSRNEDQEPTPTGGGEQDKV